MNNNSEAYFWFHVWTGKSPLKVYIPEDIWHDMPNKECTIQQSFSDPRSIHLQTALRSNIANQVWTDLSPILQFSYMKVITVADGVTSFLPELTTTAGRLTRCTFMTVPWEIWCSRNRARFKGQDMSAKHINIPTVVKWLTPPKGRLKLNVDGAFKMTSGEARGGGILRDHKGNMCCTFAKTYHGLNSSLTVEALALRDGLSICCSRGVSDVLVETDSLNLLQIVTR
ncbi:hypothetical protein Taro_035479 [Colocasia esculenta]|uniref:RNase H type-1 domain-containing protein n=1 Tax=Colocasia esculenta TaxID=4460 RepID=A0A843WIR3_COLES|nr:hypothetical protein [Colocasia esculenta]